MKALIVFGADINAVNKRNETPRHLATISKSRFRNQIIHALCLVGAAPCDPRKCNYQCNVPFKPSAFPLGMLHSDLALKSTSKQLESYLHVQSNKWLHLM